MAATILVTGFGPFPGAPFNPTGPLVERLARLRRLALANEKFVLHIFPTSYAAVDRDLPKLIARHRPDALLMFGLAPRARQGSPAPGGSSLITSAPKSDRIVAAAGPAIQLAQSMTFRPVKRWFGMLFRFQFQRRGQGERCVPAPAYGDSLEKMIVPEAANMPPTPWQTEIFAPGTCAGATPRICRTLSCSAYMPYMPECM